MHASCRIDGCCNDAARIEAALESLYHYGTHITVYYKRGSEEVLELKCFYIESRVVGLLLCSVKLLVVQENLRSTIAL